MTPFRVLCVFIYNDTPRDGHRDLCTDKLVAMKQISAFFTIEYYEQSRFKCIGFQTSSLAEVIWKIGGEHLENKYRFDLNDSRSLSN